MFSFVHVELIFRALYSSWFWRLLRLTRPRHLLLSSIRCLTPSSLLSRLKTVTPNGHLKLFSANITSYHHHYYHHHRRLLTLLVLFEPAPSRSPNPLSSESSATHSRCRSDSVFCSLHPGARRLSPLHTDCTIIVSPQDFLSSSSSSSSEAYFHSSFSYVILHHLFSFLLCPHSHTFLSSLVPLLVRTNGRLHCRSSSSLPPAPSPTQHRLAQPFVSINRFTLKHQTQPNVCLFDF